jgi:carboxylesterase
MPTNTIHLAGGEHAVLLLHGLAASPLEMNFVAKALNQSGFTVHVPYIPGLGHGTDCTEWPLWVEACRAEYARLRREFRTVSVSGICIGATLALAVAHAEQDVTALSLLSITLEYDGWVIPWYNFLLEPAKRIGLGRLYSYREREPYGLKNQQLRNKVARAMRDQAFSDAGAAVLSMDHIYQAMRLGRHVRTLLPSITTDTLIIHAIDDETSSPRNADAVLDGIGSAHKRRIFLDNSYHMITMDNDRDLVAHETIVFFEESLRRSLGLALREAGGRSGKLVSRPRRLSLPEI